MTEISPNDVLERLRQELDECRATEASLRRRAAQYEALFNQIVDAVFIHDQETHLFIHWNAAVLRIYGYSEEELRSMTPFDLHPKEELAKVHDNIDVRNVDKANVYTHLTKDSRSIDVEILTDELEYGGRPAWISVVRDISERQLLERQLLQSQKMEAIGTLAGGVAHDMNNVLAGVMGLATLLKTEMAPEDPRLGDVAEIGLLCKRGRDLARNLLGFARKGQYMRAPIAVVDLVGEAQAILERTIPRRVEIRIEHRGDEAPFVLGDSGQLSNALMNICLNAVDAMHDRGRLTITTDIVEFNDRDLLAHPTLAPGSWSRIRVSDTGRGMDQHILDHAFEPFFTTKEAGAGSGLGLSMVYGTIEHHGGFVSLDSVHDVGTTVSLHLPLAETPENPPSRSESN